MSQVMIQSLQEMFPNHSRDTIQRVVQETQGNTDAAINKLLNLKERSNMPQSSSRNPPLQSTPSQERAQEHIFPEDFLRWPKNVEWICVNSDLSDYALQADDDIGYSNSSDQMEPLPENSNLQRTEMDGGNLSGWAKLKSQFMSMGSGYNQI